MFPGRLCFIVGLIVLPATAGAAIFAREDFNYVNGNLGGNSGGVGWSAAWTNAQGTPTVVGSKASLNSISNQQGARLISAPQVPPAGGSRVVWVSFEGKQTTSLTGTTNSFGGLGLYFGNTERLLIGKAWPGPYEWRAGTGPTLVGPAVPVSTLNTTMVIARITMVDGTATANDTLDVWFNPADTSSVAALGTPQISRTSADLSFDTLRIRSGSGAGGTESWLFDAVTAGDTLADVVAADSDGDGMLDAWETLHGLIVGVKDDMLDPDNDGSKNIDEYLRSTDPQNPDSDGDGLLDGAETATGVFVSAADTGTNPLVKDSDGDGLQDNVETGTGTYVDASNTGTDPNKADTDGDGHPDSFEVRMGSNPNQAGSVPATGDLTIIGADDFTYADGAVAGHDGGTGFDFDNSTVPWAFVGHALLKSDWDDVVAGSTIVSGKLHTSNSSVKREFNGPQEGAVPGGDEYVGAVNGEPTSAGHKVYFRADMTRQAGATWSGISGYDFTVERSFVGVPSAPNPATGNQEFAIGAPAPAPVFTGIRPVAGRTYTLVMKIDYDTALVSLWINPDLTGAEPPPLITAPYTVERWTTAMRLGSGGVTEWDNAVVAREWSALGTFPGVVSANYDAWTMKYPGLGTTKGFLDDSDHDGLSNGLESVFGSDPTAANTGLRQISQAGNAMTFRHSLTNNLPYDVEARYEWSTDLIHWYGAGESDGAGRTVSITSSVIIDNAAPLNDEVEVTFTLTGQADGKFFGRLKAIR